MSALHHRRAACLAFVVPVAIVGLTACGGPTEPQTYQPRNLADAANATVNKLALRDQFKSHKLPTIQAAE